MIHPELRHAATYARGQLLAASALLGLVTASYLLQAVLLALALAAVATGATDRLPLLLAAVLGTVLLRAGLSWWQRDTASRAGALVRVRLRDALLLRLGQLGAAPLVDARAGAVRTTVVDGVEGVDAYVSRYLPQLLVTVCVPPPLLVVIGVLQPYVLLGLVPALLLGFFGPRLWDRLLARRGREHWDTYEELGADYLEALQGMPTLRAAGAVERTRDRLERRSGALHQATVAKLRVSLVDTGLTDLAVQGGTAAAALLACWSAATGQTAATGTYLLLLLISECFRPIRDLAREWHAGYLGISAAEGLTALRTARPPVADRGTETARWSTPPEVRFSGVEFGYGGGAGQVLHGVSFTAEAGRVTALVGPSGAGKSTLLALLQRHHEPQRGTLTIDGRDIAAHTLDSHRRQIAVVSQDTYLFHASVADNLRLAQPEATDEQLVQAAVRAGIHDEITALPEGYDSLLGERGATLSGGQRQRLALARALLADTPILVLDEATSAVDERREAAITAELLAAVGDRTLLLVAHRLAAVRHADRIVVLDGGRVDAVGDHESLLSANGLYAQLARAGGPMEGELAA